MLNAELTQSLALRAADVIDTCGDDASSITMGEMADGSTRHYALVTTYDKVNDLEQQFRITSPCGINAPDWSRNRYDQWAVEVLVDDQWLHLEEVA